MKYKSLAWLGVKSLGVKPLRLAFTIFLSAIAFAVFGLFDTIGAYNRTNIVANALVDNDYTAVGVNSVYYGKVESGNVGVGQDYIDEVSNNLGYDFRGVYGIQSEGTINANDDVEIIELSHSSRQDGIMYYYKHVNGFVEFKEIFPERECDLKLGDFSVENFKLIAGSNALEAEEFKKYLYKYKDLNIEAQIIKTSIKLSSIDRSAILILLNGHIYSYNTLLEELNPNLTINSFLYIYVDKTIKSVLDNEDFVKYIKDYPKFRMMPPV
jgi:hypothetical protein